MANYAMKAAAVVAAVALVVWVAGPAGPQTQMAANPPAAVPKAEPRDVERYVFAHRPYAVQNVQPVQFEEENGAAAR